MSISTVSSEIPSSPYSKGRMADCHPDRKHEARGMCRKCYHRSFNQSPKRKLNRTVYQRDYRSRHIDIVREREKRYAYKHNLKRILRRYKIGEKEFMHLMEVQGGVCAICGRTNGKFKYLAVDHCHVSGMVRGLLCKKCNSGIGFLGDSEQIVSRALLYLKGML